MLATGLLHLNAFMASVLMSQITVYSLLYWYMAGMIAFAHLNELWSKYHDYIFL